MQPTILNSEEFDQWRHSPATLQVFAMLKERKQKVAHQLALGACLGNEGKHGKAVGHYTEINDLLEMTYEEFAGVVKETNHEGNTRTSRSDD